MTYAAGKGYAIHCLGSVTTILTKRMNEDCEAGQEQAAALAHWTVTGD